MDAASTEHENEYGIGEIIGMMKRALEHGEIEVSSLVDERRSEIDNFLKELKRIVSQSTSTAEDINRSIQNSIIGDKIESFPLPSFITDKGFGETLCSLKIYNRVKFKEAILNYAGQKLNASTNTLKKKEEHILLTRAILFYGAIDESYFSSSSQPMTKIYDLSFEYRFIQYGLKSIGVDCPNKYIGFKKMCDSVTSVTDHTEQIMWVLKKDADLNEDMNATIKSIDYVFRFLKENEAEWLDDATKNGIIAYMSAFGALTETNVHYLYAIALGHNWLFQHSYYSHQNYVDEPENEVEVNVPKVMGHSFNDEGVVYPYVTKTLSLIYSVISARYGKRGPRFNTLFEHLVINSPVFIRDLQELLSVKDDIERLNNLDTKKAVEAAIRLIEEAIGAIKECVLVDESNEQAVNDVADLLPVIKEHLSQIENQYELVPRLEKSMGGIASFAKEKVPVINKEVGEMKAEADKHLKAMKIDLAKDALERISAEQQQFARTLNNFFHALKALSGLLEETAKAENSEESPEPNDTPISEAMADKVTALENQLEIATKNAYENERKLLGKNAKLESECAALKAKLSSTSNGGVISESLNKVLFQRPSTPTTLDVVKAIQEMFPHVVFADGIDKLASSSIYENPQKLFDYMVRVCNEYYPQIKDGVPDGTAKNCLGSAYSRGESNTAINNEKCRAHREFKFHGKKVLIPKHITLGSRHDKRATIQVYFDVLDGVLHIGYVGEHLPLT